MVCAPAPLYVTRLGILADAFKVVMVDVPPMLSVELVPCVNVPTPVNAVPTVRVPLFVYVPVTATLDMDNVPEMVLAAPANV